MFCENCGNEIPDNARYCGNCGNQIRPTPSSKEKNMLFALLLSFFFISLGICYAGNNKKGIILFVITFIFNFLRGIHPIYLAITMILWIFSIYETYKEVKIANGKENPHLIEDIKTLPDSENTLPVIVIILLFIICYILVNILFY